MPRLPALAGFEHVSMARLPALAGFEHVPTMAYSILIGRPQPVWP
jgi:hypothetical protein